MALKFGKKEVAAVAEVLMQDYDSAEDAAKASLEVFERIFEDRAKYVVVGQLASSREHGEIAPSDPNAVKLSLGWYSTRGDAEKAAESLWSSTQTGDTFRVWALPTFHGTPAELHAKRKEKYAEEAAKQKSAQRERILRDIEKRREAASIRAAGGKGACQCTHQSWEHSLAGSGRGSCFVADCKCEKWDEKRK